MAGDSWRIGRFDLIFYNARHKRWQFFAEDPVLTDLRPRTPGEGLHRYQIRSLLATFRNAVQSAVSSAKQNVFAIRSYDRSSSEEIALQPPDFPEWHDDFPEWHDAYKATYLDYLISTAWHDGVPDEHRRELQ